MAVPEGGEEGDQLEGRVGLPKIQYGNSHAQWPRAKKDTLFCCLSSSESEPLPQKKEKKGATHWATKGMDLEQQGGSGVASGC